MKVLAGLKSILMYEAEEEDKNMITGQARSEHDFIISFSYDLKKFIGQFNVYPIVSLDNNGSKYILACSVLGDQPVDNFGHTEMDFIELILNICEEAEFYHNDKDNSDTFYWNKTEIGTKIKPDIANKKIIITRIGKEKATVIVDLDTIESAPTEEIPDRLLVDLECTYINGDKEGGTVELIPLESE